MTSTWSLFTPGTVNVTITTGVTVHWTPPTWDTPSGILYTDCWRRWIWLIPNVSWCCSNDTIDCKPGWPRPYSPFTSTVPDHYQGRRSVDWGRVRSDTDCHYTPVHSQQGSTKMLASFQFQHLDRHRTLFFFNPVPFYLIMCRNRISGRFLSK